MKLSRITLLTAVLLAAATTRQTPTETTRKSDTKVIAVQPAGPCYWLDGIWICE